MFIFSLTFAQKKYAPDAHSSQLTLEGKALAGYSSAFDFSREEVRKGWWKYAREFGSPLNMKDYYKVTIPSETTDGNVDLEIFTQTTAGEGGTLFFLGLENTKYKEQALTMLQDFKKKFYISDLLSRIDEKLDASFDLSKAYRDEILDDRKKELLRQITQLEKEVEVLKQEIRTIERS